MINISDFTQIGATMGGGFFTGILIGYALKKVVKIVALIIGLFFRWLNRSTISTNS
jgi:uncharacterized membrane protein (Fun14 family)